jgi:hypothetical protein
MNSLDFHRPTEEEKIPAMTGVDQHSPFWAGC